MKRVRTANLVPGMVTAEDVYTYNDQLIIPKGSVLNDKTITKLEFYSIINVRIADEEENLLTEEEEPLEEPLPLKKPSVPAVEPSYSEKVRKSPQFLEFKKQFDEEVPKFRGLIDSVMKDNENLTLDNMMSFIDDLLDSDSGYVNVFDMLHNMRNYDDQTYVHSLNVSLICNVFSRWLKLTEEETRLATLCGLLHDIGKVMVPENIIKKQGKLTDEEFTLVKRHTVEGYNVLRNFAIPECIMNTALMHHERCDGSGYPFGVGNMKIDPYAKMVAIVDAFDAMTSARIYRPAMCPFKVIEIFEEEGFEKFDTRFIMTFLENIANTYLLQRVRLNDKREGEIIFINRNHFSKPTIKCGSEFIDLSKEKDLYIEAVI